MGKGGQGAGFWRGGGPAFAHAVRRRSAQVRRRSLTLPLRFYRNIATPIRLQQSLRDVSMKTAVGPVPDLRMLDRVVMNVINVAEKIVIIADGVLPVTPPPDALVAFFNVASRAQPRPGNPRENLLLMRLQRSGKLKSDAGTDQIACRWSGNTQMAMVSNG